MHMKMCVRVYVFMYTDIGNRYTYIYIHTHIHQCVHIYIYYDFFICKDTDTYHIQTKSAVEARYSDSES